MYFFFYLNSMLYLYYFLALIIVICYILWYTKKTEKFTFSMTTPVGTTLGDKRCSCGLLFDPKTNPIFYPYKQQQQDCLAEKEAYVADNRSWLTTNGTDAWDQYVKYGRAAGETWNGSGCPSLFLDSIEPKLFNNNSCAVTLDIRAPIPIDLKSKCIQEKEAYTKDRPWLPSQVVSDAWEHYIKYGKAAGETWNRYGCPTIYSS
jgi:hypothetical protein